MEAVPWCFGSFMLLGTLYLLVTSFFGGSADWAGGLADGVDNALEGVGIDLIPDAGADVGGSKGVGCGLIAAFAAGFGLVGMTTNLLGAGVIASILWSVPAGAVFGALYFGLMRFLQKQLASSSASGEELVGRRARVTINTPPGEVGQVSITVAGEWKTFPAVEVERKPLSREDNVEIVGFEGGRVFVKKL